MLVVPAALPFGFFLGVVAAAAGVDAGEVDEEVCGFDAAAGAGDGVEEGGDGFVDGFFGEAGALGAADAAGLDGFGGVAAHCFCSWVRGLGGVVLEVGWLRGERDGGREVEGER